MLLVPDAAVLWAGAGARTVARGRLRRRVLTGCGVSLAPPATHLKTCPSADVRRQGNSYLMVVETLVGGLTVVPPVAVRSLWYTRSSNWRTSGNSKVPVQLTPGVLASA